MSLDTMHAQWHLYIPDTRYTDYTLGIKVFYFYVNVGVEQKTNQIFHGCRLIPLFINLFPDLPGKTIAAITPASVSVEQGKFSSLAKKK